jgi:hypothetical protein
MPRLIVKATPSHAEAWSSYRLRTTVGRPREMTSVSKTRLLRDYTPKCEDGGQVLAERPGSANGTLLNGFADAAQLQDGDQIRSVNRD